MAFVHSTCLDLWMARGVRINTNCEICRAKYLEPKRVLLPLREWHHPTLQLWPTLAMLALVPTTYTLAYFGYCTYRLLMADGKEWRDFCQIVHFLGMLNSFRFLVCYVTRHVLGYWDRQHRFVYTHLESARVKKDD